MISAGSVKKAAKQAGADLVGIASTDRFKDYPEDKRPEHLLPGARSVIVVGVRVLLDTVKPNLLLSALHHITLNIYPKLFGISTRHAAVEAGLGIFGKSRLLITPRFGPRQRVAAVITNAELKPDRKITEKEANELCPPSCQACIRACPGKALSNEGIAWEKCNEVIKPHNSMYRYSACSQCMIVCPIGRKI